MTVEVYDEPEAFAGVAGAWDALVRGSPRPCPFYLSGWLLARWRAGEPMRVVVASTPAGPAAGMPLALRRGLLRYGMLPTPGEDVVARRGADEAVHEVLEAAGRQGLSYLEHVGIRETSPLGSLGRTFRRPVPTDGMFVLSMPDGWEAAYAGQFSAKTRSNHARGLRRLADQGHLEIDVVREPERVEAALHECFRLHRLRWSGLGDDRSSFADERGREWNLAAARTLAAADVVRLLLLKLDGVPIAFAYNFLLAGTLWGHRQSFDPRWGKHSPGLLAVMRSVELAAAEGATRVEFMTGEHGYKSQLSNERTRLYWGLFMPRGPLGAAAASQRFARFLVLRRLHGRRILSRARRARALLLHPAR